jgi:hypothetical protein
MCYKSRLTAGALVDTIKCTDYVLGNNYSSDLIVLPQLSYFLHLKEVFYLLLFLGILSTPFYIFLFYTS